MNNHNLPHFELENRQVLDGEVIPIPILSKSENFNVDITNSLFLAAEIVAATKLHEEEGLTDLVDHIGHMLTDPTYDKGLILEEENGFGALKISRDSTSLRIRGRGVTEIPTTLLFDMLYFWNNPKS